jgi:hypothetical protein
MTAAGRPLVALGLADDRSAADAAIRPVVDMDPRSVEAAITPRTRAISTASSAAYP